MPNLNSILKGRYYFANKGPPSQSYSFSSTGCESWTTKKPECQRIDMLEIDINYTAKLNLLYSKEWKACYKLSSVAQSCLTLWPHGPQHTGLPCPSPTPRDYSNSYPLHHWCHPTISSFVVPLSSCLQSFPVSGSFSRSQFFTSGGQSIGVSASASVLPMNTQHWFPLGWTSWISLKSKGLSGVFFNTTVQKHPFFGTQLSL